MDPNKKNFNENATKDDGTCVEYEIENNANNVNITFSESFDSATNVLHLTLTNNGKKKIKLTVDPIRILFLIKYDDDPYYTSLLSGLMREFYYKIRESSWIQIGTLGNIGSDNIEFLLPNNPVDIYLKIDNKERNQPGRNDLNQDNLWFGLNIWVGDDTILPIPKLIRSGNKSKEMQDKLANGELILDLDWRFKAP